MNSAKTLGIDPNTIEFGPFIGATPEKDLWEGFDFDKFVPPFGVHSKGLKNHAVKFCDHIDEIHLPKDRTDESILPGWTSLPLYLYYLPKMVHDFAMEIFHKDFHAAGEILVTGIQVPLYLFYASVKFSAYFLEVILPLFLTVTITFSMVNALTLVGSLLCGIEFTMQAKWIHRTQKFRKQFTFKEETLLQDLEKIEEKYFTISSERRDKIRAEADGDPELEKKLINELQTRRYRELCRIVRPAHAKKIAENLPYLIKEVKLGDTLEAKKLMKAIDKQCTKRITLGLISITAVLFALTGTILMPFTGVVGVALAATFIGLASTGIWFVKYSLFSGTMDNSGWKFTAKSLIPEGVRDVAKRIYMKATGNEYTDSTLKVG
ncbi:MAG: hypothetical protein ChlgKO_08410 [Chlamydiales bacterium]